MTSDPDVRRDEAPPAGRGLGETAKQVEQHAKNTAATPAPQARRYRVEIIRPQDGKPSCGTPTARDRADEIAATLRNHGIWSQVRRVDDDPKPAAEAVTEGAP